jgi:hypothetical protein
MGNFSYQLSEGREIVTIDDFFEFLRRHVQKNTFAYAYYTYPARMNKTLGSRDNLNPLFGRVFKHKPYEFRWEQSYAEAVKLKDPDYVFKGGTTEYKPLEGIKIVKEGPNGLYFPIVPTGGGGKPVYTVDWQEVSIEEIAQYLPPVKEYPPDATRFIPMLIERVAGLSAGGAVWKNPDFKFQYLGQSKERF